MNNNRPPIRTIPAPGRCPRSARPLQRGTPVWPGKRGLLSCAVLCLVLVIAPSACGSSHASSRTPKNRVVFDQTVSANLVTPDFTLTGSHQTLAWTCDPAALHGTGFMIIFIGAAGSDPATAQELAGLKGACNTGTDTLQIPPGSYFLKFAPDGSWHITLTDIDYSPSVATAIARGILPIKTPNGTHPLSPSMGYQTAWGPHVATGTYSLTLDATHTFIASAVSPDGTMLLGNERINSGPGASTYQAGYFNLATRVFTPIGVSQSEVPVECCSTDGRFLVADNTDCLGCTGGPLHELYWVYDLDTRQLRLVAKGSAYQGIENIWLTHGLLILQTGVGFLVANLPAGSLAPLTPSSTATGEIVQVDDFVWPYLLYEVTPTSNAGDPATPPPSTIRVYNFSTHQNTHLSSLEAFRATIPGQSEAYTIGGDTLYVTVFSGQTFDSLGDLVNAGKTAIYVLPHVLSGGTGRQLLATFKDQTNDFISGDTLYVTVASDETYHGGAVVNPGVTTLYALSHVLSGDSQPQVLATLSGTVGSIVGANTRAIAFFGEQLDSTTGQELYFQAVWDLALHALVTFPTLTGIMVGFSISLTGTDLAVEQGNQSDESVLFFDTSTLPTTPTGG